MIAPRQLPSRYAAWNHRWHAPHGRSVAGPEALAWSRLGFWWRGPFGFQANNETRAFEYPWVYEQVCSRVSPGCIVDIGGSLAGLQFVFARERFDVINVDPGMAARGHGWQVTPETHAYMCEVFRAPVRLVPASLQEARLPPASIDCAISVSTLEHLTARDLDATAAELRRVLKPSAPVVLTVDLFLDLRPFSHRGRNEWGTNIDIRRFLERAGLELVDGNPAELHGFPEFDAGRITRGAADFLRGSQTSLVQCLVASRGDR